MAWIEITISEISGDFKAWVNSDHVGQILKYDEHLSRVKFTHPIKDGKMYSVLIKESVEDVLRMLEAAGEKIVPPLAP